jgi:hypothetical protein
MRGALRRMFEQSVHSDRDLLIYGIPLFLLTLACVLRLDELFARPRKKPFTPRRPTRSFPTNLPHGIEPDGRAFSLSEPDPPAKK